MTTATTPTHRSAYDRISTAQANYIESQRKHHSLTEGDLLAIAGRDDLSTMSRKQASKLLDLLLGSETGELRRMAMKAKGQLDLEAVG